jgi:hypothetical protein
LSPPNRDRAIGHDAERLRDLFRTALARDKSIFFGWTQLELNAACWEAARDNWDGYGARAVDPDAYQKAVAFLQVLPVSLPGPEVAIDPDGEISFTWQRDLRRLFSVSVGPSNTLSYAGLLGQVSTYGTEYFADELPPSILVNLARLYPKGS